LSSSNKVPGTLGFIYPGIIVVFDPQAYFAISKAGQSRQKEMAEMGFLASDTLVLIPHVKLDPMYLLR